MIINKTINKINGYFLLAVLAFFIGMVLENHVLDVSVKKSTLNKFQQTFHEKERRLSNLLEAIGIGVVIPGELNKITYKLNNINKELAEDALCIAIYENDTLIYWTDNNVLLSNIYHNDALAPKIVFLENAWFYVKVKEVDNFTLMGLVLVKHEFPYENKYLENRFHRSFKLSKHARLNLDIENNANQGFIIQDIEGDRLFSLDFEQYLIGYDGVNTIKPLLFYILAAFFLFIFFRTLIHYYRDSQNTVRIILFVSALLFVLIRLAMVYGNLPKLLYSFELFSPAHYAASNWLPSLGDYLLNAIFISFFIFLCWKYLIFPTNLNSKIQQNNSTLRNEKSPGINFIISYVNKNLDIVRYALLSTCLLILFVVIHFLSKLFSSLIIDSNISFEAHNILDLSLYSFIGLTAIVLFYFSFGLLMDKIITYFKDKISFFNFALYSNLFFILLAVIITIAGLALNIISFLFLLVLFNFMSHRQYKASGHFSYSTFALLVFIYSVYAVSFIEKVTQEKTVKNEKVMIVNLATEHDPVAELLFNNVENELFKDEVLMELINSSGFTYEEIYSYLRKKYFSGYWGKYDLQLTICNPYDTLLVQPDNIITHCYGFFNEMVENRGVSLPGSNFYFLDNLNGRISYFGYIRIMDPDSESEKVRLFMQLDSRLITEELGYPDLLLEGDFVNRPVLENYSYAKYVNNILVTQSGNFTYSLTGEYFPRIDENFSYLSMNGFTHLIYELDDENFIVLSKEDISFFDIIVSFSYIFVFYFLIITLSLVLFKKDFLKTGLESNFKNRIQYSMISILLLSLLMVGGGSIYFSISQYKSKHNEMLSEKMQSIYIELVHELEFEDRLTREWRTMGYDNLDELLQKFSNVFYTDINLYDEKGNLLATSRPEIFDKGLKGYKMHPVAYQKLHEEKRAEFIHDETIGKLNYLSAYVPFVNNNNQLLAYLNLPYFAKERPLSKEVSTLVVAILNIYVLLILLSVSFAVFISNKITLPLKLIQEKFREIEIGKKYEKIEYNQQDEISSLVNEYNRMVEELEKSIELLAKSERETAWREMARQIAHEIKNPLTPMRLSVQHLKRAWDDRVENWDDYIDRFTKTLIEQIDNLSSIASAFSNFAQMPGAKYTSINLVSRIKNSVGLFENSHNIAFQVQFNDLQEAYIYADKEQINRVFINLIKNAVQAIPGNQQGTINISLNKEDEYYKVEISDNGVGIRKEMMEKMFQPYFTTKSGGTGLGLSIAKNIIENAGGGIHYKTEEGLGTTFTITFPVHK